MKKSLYFISIALLLLMLISCNKSEPMKMSHMVGKLINLSNEDFYYDAFYFVSTDGYYNIEHLNEISRTTFFQKTSR